MLPSRTLYREKRLCDEPIINGVYDNFFSAPPSFRSSPPVLTVPLALRRCVLAPPVFAPLLLPPKESPCASRLRGPTKLPFQKNHRPLCKRFFARRLSVLDPINKSYSRTIVTLTADQGLTFTDLRNPDLGLRPSLPYRLQPCGRAVELHSWLYFWLRVFQKLFRIPARVQEKMMHCPYGQRKKRPS